jgi:hypothetical protein
VSARVTAAGRRSGRSAALRTAATLSEYDRVNREFAALKKERERLRKEVDLIDDGTYAGWEKSHGAPKQITDMDAVYRVFDEIGRAVPKKESEPPLMIKHVG